jgi:hypothetical protein
VCTNFFVSSSSKLQVQVSSLIVAHALVAEPVGSHKICPRVSHLADHEQFVIVIAQQHRPGWHWTTLQSRIAADVTCRMWGASYVGCRLLFKRSHDCMCEQLRVSLFSKAASKENKRHNLVSECCIRQVYPPQTQLCGLWQQRTVADMGRRPRVRRCKTELPLTGIISSAQLRWRAGKLSESASRIARSGCGYRDRARISRQRASCLFCCISIQCRSSLLILVRSVIGTTVRCLSWYMTWRDAIPGLSEQYRMLAILHAIVVVITAIVVNPSQARTRNT